MKLDYEEMMIAWRDASSDTEMRDNALRDTRRLLIDGEWYAGSDRLEAMYKNRPKPEMNKLFKAIMRIVGNVNDMELGAEISAYSNDADEDGAELLEKVYRHDCLSSDAVEASENATMEAAICGFGATEQIIKYIDPENPKPEERFVSFEIVESAVSCVFFNAGARRKDKSDATRGWRLIRVNRKETAEEFGRSIVSFDSPTTEYENNNRLNRDTRRDVYIAKYWEKKSQNESTYDFSMLGKPMLTKLIHVPGEKVKDENGQEYNYEYLQDLREFYKEEIGEDAPKTTRKISCVYFSYADGQGWLGKTYKRPFKRIPLYPRYWYHATVQGVEYYCGEVRKKTDLEMFNNIAASQLMEAMGGRATELPEYAPEQVVGLTNQLNSELINNPAYRLTKPIRDDNGNIIHQGPLAVHQPTQAPPAVLSAIGYLDQNLKEENGTGQATVPSNTSAQAIQQVNERADDSYLPAVKSVMHAIKSECEGYIPAAQQIYFTNPTKVMVMEIDGTKGRIETMVMQENNEGYVGAYGNNPRGIYKVTVKQGEAYKDTIQKEIEDNNAQLQYAGTDTPAGQIMLYRNMQLQNRQKDAKIAAIAKYSQLDAIIMSGFPYEPQDEEEAAYIQQKQQQMQQQNAMAQQQMEMQQQALLNAQLEAAAKEANARENEGKAAIMNEINDANKLQIDMFKAETDRAKVDVEAQKAGAEIDIKQSELMLKQVNALSGQQFA